MEIKVIDIPVAEHTTSPDIYTLRKVYRKDGTIDFVINGNTVYNADEWTLSEAIEQYLSAEAEEQRETAFRKAWGFYD